MQADRNRAHWVLCQPLYSVSLMNTLTGNRMMELAYWHWVVVGLLLMGFEMIVPSFTILWFGAGAIVTGIVLAFFPISLTSQVVIWTVSSILFTVFWFKYLKPLSVDRTKAGLPKESIIGETGLLIKEPVDHHRGIMRFTTPKLGSDEWPIICEDDVKVGDRVRVKSVSGNALVVSVA